MAKNKFIMLNLEEEPAKELAEVLSSEKSRAILNYLADKEHATASEISKALNIPLSTLNYQLKKVVASGLVDNDEFHYSKKGKTIEHYKLAQKHIIISPKKVKGLKSKLANLLPLVPLGIGAIMLQVWQSSKTTAQMAMMEAAPLTARTAEVVQDSAVKPGGLVPEPSMEGIAATTTSVSTSEPNLAIWFLLGGLITFIVFYILTRRKE